MKIKSLTVAIILFLTSSTILARDTRLIRGLEGKIISMNKDKYDSEIKHVNGGYIRIDLIKKEVQLVLTRSHTCTPDTPCTPPQIYHVKLKIEKKEMNDCGTSSYFAKEIRPRPGVLFEAILITDNSINHCYSGLAKTKISYWKLRDSQLGQIHHYSEFRGEALKKR